MCVCVCVCGERERERGEKGSLSFSSFYIFIYFYSIYTPHGNDTCRNTLRGRKHVTLTSLLNILKKYRTYMGGRFSLYSLYCMAGVSVEREGENLHGRLKCERIYVSVERGDNLHGRLKCERIYMAGVSVEREGENKKPWIFLQGRHGQ